MHGLLCSSLSHCFETAAATTNPTPPAETNSSVHKRNNNGVTPADPVMSQPQTRTDSPQEKEHKQLQRTFSYGNSCSTRVKTQNSTHVISEFSISKDKEVEDPIVPTLPSNTNSCETQEEDFELDCCPDLGGTHPQIPRPSIVLNKRKDSEFQETESHGFDNRETQEVELSDPRDPGLSLPPGRRVMAEPDYLDGDCDELIKPKKLINPVKNSRNHQDLHRELLMNQKRGLAPQNKPELQKVLEKRKREQIIKAQKEEQEAHKKKSDLEIELMKRQQKLEQLELEQQKNEEEQENTPEFVKMKSNLRRTKQETEGEERTT